MSDNNNNSHGNRFTGEEKERINRTIFQCRMVGATHEETRTTIQKLIGKTISPAQYYRYSDSVLNDNESIGWLTQFARTGYIAHYQDRVNNLIFIGQELMKLFIEEKNKKDPNIARINSLARNIRENELALAALGFGSPVLLKMKELMDKTNEHVNNNNVNNKRYNIPDQEPRQNSTEDNRNTSPATTEPTDDNRVT